MRTGLSVSCFAVVSLACLALPSDAIGCSCVAPGPPCEQAFQADAVFAATVHSVSLIPDNRPVDVPGGFRPPRGFRVELADVVAFLGVQTQATVITTPLDGGSCGYRFAEGERYLIYAYRDANGNLSTTICSRTRPLAEAAEDLRFLESLPVAPRDSGARVYGQITHFESDFSGSAVSDYGPLSNIVVTARGPGGSFESRTDADGRYELRIPPGPYSVLPAVPPGFSERYLERRIDLRDARACHQADFVVHFDGRIAGMIDAQGTPASNIAVELMAAEPDDRPGVLETQSRSTNADGRFEFTDLPPGRYRIGLDLTRTMREGPVYPRTFHPGTEDPATATIIELGGGQRVELLPMLLPAPRRQHRLFGVVTLSDGKPAGGSFVSLSDGQEPWRQVATVVETERDGTFSFVVHEGLEYRARAFLNPPSGRQLQGATASFRVTGETTIAIVLSD